MERQEPGRRESSRHPGSRRIGIDEPSGDRPPRPTRAESVPMAQISRQSVKSKLISLDRSTVAFNPEVSLTPYLSGTSFLAALMAF
jgi:hypothetical protein